MSIFIAKVTLSKEVSGSENIIFHKFASQEEINAYLRNSRYILDFEIVKVYTDLTFEEFNNLWSFVFRNSHDIENAII